MLLQAMGPGEVVTREELRHELWPADTYVDFEQGINAAVKRLREALGDSAETPRFIETLPKRGYRFIAPINSPGAATSEASVDQAIGQEEVRRIHRNSLGDIRDVAGVLQPEVQTAEGRRGPAGTVNEALGAPPVHTRRWRRTAYLVSIGAALLLVVAAGSAMWNWRDAARPDAPEVQHRQVTFTGDARVAALSPDGRSLAYTVGEPGSHMKVFVRDIAASQASMIWSGQAVWDLGWLPNGSEIVVSGEQSKSGMWIVPRFGGVARRVANGASSFTVSPDGESFAWTSLKPGFGVLSLKAVKQRWVDMRGFLVARTIDWHARTDRIVLLTSDNEGAWTIWSVAPDGQEQTMLWASTQPIAAICTSPVADVVYALRERGRTSDLVQIPIRGRTANTDRVLVTGLPLSGGWFHALRCTVSSDGRQLLYGRRATYGNLWRLDLEPSVQAVRPITQGTLQITWPDVYPDGQWIAATEGPETDSQVVKIPIAGGELVRLGEGSRPVWAPDGRRLAFVSRRSGSARVWITPADVEWPEEVKDSAIGQLPPVWLPDGRLGWQTVDHRNYRIRDLKTGRDELLVPDGSVGWIFSPRFSPRGDQVAVLWNRPPKGLALWLLSWPPRKEHAVPATKSTGDPQLPIGWSRDGEVIYATSSSLGRTIIRVSARTGKAQPVGQFPVGSLGGNCSFAAHHGAIICSIVEEKTDAWVTENFDPEIRHVSRSR